MSLILSIDTATPVCSVALHQQELLLGNSDLFLEKSHSNMLAVMIEELVQNSGASMSDIKAIGVSQGPGSYTGLRIGIATAKGLCYGLGVPLIAIDTLSAMAQQVIPLEGDRYWYCPMIDARRMEVYCQMVTHQQETILPTQAVVVDERSFQEQLAEKPVMFFGNGSEKCREVITHGQAEFLEGVEASAVTVGQLALAKFQEHDFEDLAYFEPNYLKEFRSIPPKKRANILK